MNREQLEHAIRAACEVSKDDELIIFGSQAILGQYAEAEKELTRSVEVDATPKNKPEAVINIDGALGEGSSFHQTFGFYVHGLSIEAAILPERWEERMIEVSVKNIGNETKTGWCIEAHDLAASKLIAFRSKDKAFVRTMLIEQLIDIETLIKRIKEIKSDHPNKKSALKWALLTSDEL